MYNIVKYTLKEVRGMADLKIYVYQLRTPLLKKEIEGKEKYYNKYVDFNIINIVFKYINSLNDSYKVKTYEKSKTMKLIHYNEHYNENFAYGRFKTVEHGEVGKNVDVRNFETISEYDENEGREKIVQFLIDKRSGYLYIERDRSSVINLSRLNSYFKVMFPTKDYKAQFNASNDNNVNMTDRNIINFVMLEPIPFIEQLKQITVLKSVKATVEKETVSNQRSGIISNLKSQALNRNLGEFNAEIELKQFDRQKLSDEMIGFIQYIIDSQSYENIKVKGKTANEVIRTFSPDTFTRDIIISCDVDIEGNATDSQFYDEINNIVDYDIHLRVEHKLWQNINYTEVSEKNERESETDSN